MNDFEVMITKAMKGGMSPEDIAKQLSEALNSVANKSKEDEARAKHLDALHETLVGHFDEGKFTIGDAAAMITLIVANDTEKGKSWNADQIAKFFTFASEKVKAMPAMFDASTTMRDAVSDFTSMLENIINKSKDNNGGTDRRDGSCSCTIHKVTESDAQKINRFLESLM